MQGGTITNTVVVVGDVPEPNSINNYTSVDVVVEPLVTQRFVYLQLMLKVAGGTS
jgi:hypothetical protein